VFATLTAPSFGPVHTRHVNPRTGKVAPCRMRRSIERCPHGKPMVCTQRHTDNHPSLGRPLCLDCYDHAHHVVWNCWAGELWRRTTIAITRALRPLEVMYGVKLRISYGKVAEYQRRGVVHFHALIRLDTRDPDNLDAILAPPADITARDLAELVADTVATVSFETHPYADTGHTWPMHWGPQLDVRPVGNLGTGEITSEAVAAYLAKYATKATETTGLPPTGRMTAEAAEHYSDAHTHLGCLIAYAYQLGGLPHDWTTDEQKADWHKTWGKLRRWTHMLGFGGHFSTKSRRYSTTHKALRAQRRAWHRTSRTDWRRRHIDRLEHEHDDETTLIVCQLTLAGIGWNTTADAQLAADAADRARAHRQLVKEERRTASA
jgi:hypothetical protein